MDPMILGSIAQGFKAAARSWPAIGVVLLIGGIWQGGQQGMLTSTDFPREALGEIQEDAPAGVLPSPLPGPVLAPDADEATTATEAQAITEERVALLQEWWDRAWFAALALYAVGLIGWVWVTAGELGYLKAQLQDGRAPLATFLASARSRFVPVLETAGLLMGAGCIGAMAFLLVLSLALAIGGGGSLGLFLVSLAVMSSLVGFVWLGVRLAFWLVAVVVDDLSPLEALRRSFAVVQGRWWMAFGLLALLTLMGTGISLLLSLLVGLIGFGAGAGMAAAFEFGLGLVASAFLGFVFSGALIAWYRQVNVS